MKSLSHVRLFAAPWTVAWLLRPWDSPGKNTGVGYHFLHIKKRWQEYTELYKMDLNDPDNHDGVVTHLQPDILEYEVKWALGRITRNKAIGDDGIPVELF